MHISYIKPIYASNPPGFTKTAIQQTALQLFKGTAAEYLLAGGSRSGKSFIIIYTQVLMAATNAGSRHLIARYRFIHARDTIWLDTLKKVINLCFPHLKVTWHKSQYYVQLFNGSQIWLAGLDDSDRTEKVLGMEFLTAFLNEASQISYNAYNIIKTRLAQKIPLCRPTLFIDANPPSKRHWLYKVFIENVDPESNSSLNPHRYASLKMNPAHNLVNISDNYIETLNSLPLSKRKRFLDGEFADDSDGALWTDDLINTSRIRRHPDGSMPVSFKRIVVSIDPAVSSKDTSDETGIIVAGLGFDDHLYVLDDASGIYSPNDWARAAVAFYHKYKADRIIGEANNGGDLIEAVLRHVDGRVSYKSVHATRDKLTRAEPIAAIYEQGKAHHVDILSNLELEMTTWEAKKGHRSPNRIDALVWAATELCLNGSIITGKAKFGFSKNV